MKCNSLEINKAFRRRTAIALSLVLSIVSIDHVSAQLDSATAKTIQKKLDELADQKEIEFVGKLKMIKTSVSLYDYNEYLQRRKLSENAKKQLNRHAKDNNRGKDTTMNLEEVLQMTRKDFVYKVVTEVSVDSIELSIVEGVIDNVRVSLGDRIFTNRGRPISLVNYDRADKVLFDVDGSEILLLGDIMQYLPKVDRHYVPDDELVVLRADKRSHGLKASVDLNSSVELRVFSDLLGLFGEQGNGLVQTELSSKIFANTVPQTTKLGPFYLGNFVEPYFKYAKFDTKFSSVEISDTISSYYITDMEQLLMNQQSFINLGLRVNYAKMRVSNTFLELNFGLEYNYVKVKPANAVDPTTANLGSFYMEMRGGLSRSKNFGLTYSLDFLLQTVQNTQFETVEGSTRRYLKPMFEMFYHPSGNPSNKIFFRFQTFVDFDTSLSYANLQFGYSARIGVVNKR